MFYEIDEKDEPGVCAIKSEFVLTDHIREITLENVSERDKKLLETTENDFPKEKNDSDGEPTEKMPKLSKKEKKRLRGQNKKRPVTFDRKNGEQLCRNLFNIGENEKMITCKNKNCKKLHDIKKYLEIKPEDIGEDCSNFNLMGCCPQGPACRFSSKHITEEGRNIINQEIYEKYNAAPPSTCNRLTKELQISLRKRTYDFSETQNIVEIIDKQIKRDRGTLEEKLDSSTDEEDVMRKEHKAGNVIDEDIIKIRPCEKKEINWKGKLYLSPLTTVGNLPFRRICKEFGADITCGEMAVGAYIVQASGSEWALVKRHSSEDLFGVQLCGNNPYSISKAAQLLKENATIDFVDLNVGCPIDLVYKQGAGCGLLRRPRTFESIVRSVSTILGEIPLTCKMRMGVYSDKPITHKLLPKLVNWGVSMITVHGRSREQRYTRSADWEYIERCAKITAPTPIFGNGDLLNWEDYEKVKNNYTNVSGVMIGRGALIKPWIFTEMKEKRVWDINSNERFDIIKKYVHYGLEHWGSDFRGVETTRRFLLEWLSFLHRYVPVGILVHPLQKINERPPSYHGRDNLETLLSSSACQDWIKISEMLLGPVPSDFVFLPKHKANSFINR